MKIKKYWKKSKQFDEKIKMYSVSTHPAISYVPKQGNTGANASQSHLWELITELSTFKIPFEKSVIGSVIEGSKDQYVEFNLEFDK